MKRVKNLFNDAIIFSSNAAVGLILQDNRKADSGASMDFALGRGPKPDYFIGGYYSPEEARDIGNALLRFAEEALAVRDRVYTDDERSALLAAALRRD
jgi:hypothetical protein